MNAIKLKENIYWVGAVDSNLRLFHGYSTEKGSTYNAYLIIDKEITLIDTVKKHFVPEMISRIKSVIDPTKISNIILNHVEPDHSGGILEISALCPNAKIYASAGSGVAGIKNYFGINPLPLKTSENITTGKYHFDFIQTPMLHWPDNMVCYLREEKILFSNDAFGQHYATYSLLDTQNVLSEILEQAKKYYANIVLPFATQVKKALSDVSSLEIRMIAPSHGVIWSKHIPEIMQLYTDIVQENFQEKAVVVYDTMWQSTEIIAKTITSALLQKNIKVVSMSLQANHISDIITEISDCKYLCVGSPTLNNNMLPTVAGFLCYLKGLAPKNKKFIAFGSYGWGGQSIKQVHCTLLQDCGFTPLQEPISCQYRPSDEFLKKTYEQIMQIKF